MDYAPEDGGNAGIFVQRELLLHVNRRPTDAMVAAGPDRAHLAILDVPGYGESASYGRMVPDGLQTHSILTAGHISLYSMYPVMGNQRPTDAWCPMGYRPTAFSRPET